MTLIAIIIVCAVVVWLGVSLPVAVIIGRMSRRAELGSPSLSPMMTNRGNGSLVGTTGSVGSITR